MFGYMVPFFLHKKKGILVKTANQNSTQNFMTPWFITDSVVLLDANFAL